MEDRETICRRCGSAVIWAKDYDDRGRYRTFYFNRDGSPHKCEVKIGVDPDRMKFYEFKLSDLIMIEKYFTYHFDVNKVLMNEYKRKIPQRTLHKLRFDKHLCENLFKELRNRLEYHRWKLKLIEKLLKIQWLKLWDIPTHLYHYKAIDYFFIWYKEYYETLYPNIVCSIGAIQRIMGYTNAQKIIESLEEFRRQLSQILELIESIRDISISGGNKGEKSYWLRQLQRATEWQRILNTSTLNNKTTITLDYEDAINEAEQNLANTFQDKYADITGSEDHGYYVLLNRGRIVDSMKMLFGEE